jgi:hypothetical protein
MMYRALQNQIPTTLVFLTYPLRCSFKDSGVIADMPKKLIAEMLSMGHLLEADKLIVGKEFFLEPAETVQLPHRSQQDEQVIESE